jgi:hypothetical protein
MAQPARVTGRIYVKAGLLCIFVIASKRTSVTFSANDLLEAMGSACAIARGPGRSVCVSSVPHTGNAQVATVETAEVYCTHEAASAYRDVACQSVSAN